MTAERPSPERRQLGRFADAPTGFVARPPWQRRLWRLWRRQLVARLPTRRGRAARVVVPPREWSQEEADYGLRRGMFLSEERGWKDIRP